MLAEDRMLTSHRQELHYSQQSRNMSFLFMWALSASLILWWCYWWSSRHWTKAEPESQLWVPFRKLNSLWCLKKAFWKGSLCGNIHLSLPKLSVRQHFFFLERFYLWPEIKYEIVNTTVPWIGSGDMNGKGFCILIYPSLIIKGISFCPVHCFPSDIMQFWYGLSQGPPYQTQ